MDLARDGKPPDFEKALAELEALVERLERGDLPLDEGLKTFERGVAPTRPRQASLQAAPPRGEILLKKSGQAQIVPFEEPTHETAGRPAGSERRRRRQAPR